MTHQKQTTASIATDNQRSLQRLIRAIELSKGQFALILVRCNYRQLREGMLKNLRAVTKSLYLRELFLDPSATVLHTTIVRELYLDHPAVATDSLPSAVTVFGLDANRFLEDLLTGINQARDIYAATFPFPLVLWLTDEVATSLSRLAPDFKSWAATTIKFEMEQTDLIDLVQQQTENLFSQILATGADKFLSNAALDLAPSSQHRREIEAARNDLLRLYGVNLASKLEASLEFVLGRDGYANDEIDEALNHFHRSLEIWQQEIRKQEDIPDNPQLNCPIVRKAIVLFHLGLCYRRMADLQPPKSHSHWQKALLWFKQCVAVLQTARQPDLVAKFIVPACEMLQKLEVWDELAQLAKIACKLHEQRQQQAQVAQDYGFLAAVAAAKSDWLQVYELANTALSLLEVATDVSRQQESKCLLLLGRAQRHLGEWEEAVNNLEWARVVCELQYEPSLYLEIVEELRSLYFFERHNYLEAFKLKQEKIQIEHQYGFRAFIGANQLQPQRYRINPVIQTPTVSLMPEDVAQEIAASGRQQDVNRLIERISRADYKLTIIHGPSGVGKSSILKAGLLPALRQQVIGGRIPLPIILSAYSEWITALGRSLNQALAQTDLAIPLEITPGIVIEKLRLLADNHHTIVLVFDQFEELFFVIKDGVQRKEFYDFFCDCLNLPYVKVIISLREDYLHYLLEIERLSRTKHNTEGDLGVINRNILDKDIRYYLGNFSVADAQEIIHSLTQRSHFELSDELTQQLVQDLASSTGEVHPIELQIVGAQLQTENITTFSQYQHSGGVKRLVARWLGEVIKDCGRENEEVSWQLLFELTDRKGTRPLKTKPELALAIITHPDAAHKCSYSWELILDILVDSGLVLRMREETGDRYQLVHDYLVEPIRQKKSHGMVAELERVRLEKSQAEIAKKVSQNQLTTVLHKRLKEARIVGTVLAMMSSVIAGLWWQADLQKRAAMRQSIRAESSESNLKISALTAASEALFASNKEFDALLESLRAWRQLKQSPRVEPETRMRVVSALQQAVYGVKELNRLEGHSEIVWGVSFSPDGQLMASGSRDRTIKIWRPDGTLLQTLTGHNDAVTSLSFSPDSQTLASASLDKTVQIWRRDPITGEFISQPQRTLAAHGDWVYSVNFSPDGQMLATGSKDGTIKLWNLDGTMVQTMRGHQDWVNWVNFSPDGQLLASASEDQTVKIWRRDGSLVTTLAAHRDGATNVTFSPDSQTLATVGRDQTVKIWLRQNNGQGFIRQNTFKQNASVIWSVKFSPDGQYLASGGDDNMIYLWNVKNNTLVKTLKGHSDAIASLSFSPNHQLLASASYDKSIKIWSLQPPQLQTLQGHTDQVVSVSWSPDGKLLASSSRDRTIKLWTRYLSDHRQVATKFYKTLTGHQDRVASVSFSPDGQILASASYDRTIKLWTRNGQLIKTLPGHKDSIMSVTFSPNGQFLASASKDKTVKIWDLQGHLISTLIGHSDRVNHVSFSPDSQIIASASDDQTVKLWHKDGTLLNTLSPHKSWVLGVSFSPTDRLLASASWDNTVKLWSWDGKLLKTLLKGYSDSVNAVTFSPNGEILAAASWDSTVKLWSLDGKLIKTLNGHTAPVLSISFSPDGQTLASAGDDNKIILWNLDMNDLLGRGCSWVKNYLQHNHNVEGEERLLCEGVPGQNLMSNE
jgi:WD40 repeat protein/tetratricopeptide (TPR) repeat protein